MKAETQRLKKELADAKQQHQVTQGLLKTADKLVETQSVPPTALKPILDQHWSTPKNLTPTAPNLDIVQKALDGVSGQCKQLKDEQEDLQQQFNSANEELRTLKSNVDNGGENKMDGDTPSVNSRSKGKETKKELPKKENSTSNTDDDDFSDEIEVRPAPKVNRNYSYDLNPCCLTYVHQHIPNNV